MQSQTTVETEASEVYARYTARFKLTTFIAQFLFHALAPYSVPVYIYLYGKSAAKLQGFWPTNAAAVFFEYVFTTIALVINIFTFSLYPNQIEASGRPESVEALICIKVLTLLTVIMDFAMFARIFSISVKYAFVPEDAMQRMFAEDMPPEEMESNQAEWASWMLANWMSPSVLTVAREVDSAGILNGIDVSDPAAYFSYDASNPQAVDMLEHTIYRADVYPHIKHEVSKLCQVWDQSSGKLPVRVALISLFLQAVQKTKIKGGMIHGMFISSGCLMFVFGSLVATPVDPSRAGEIMCDGYTITNTTKVFTAFKHGFTCLPNTDVAMWTTCAIFAMFLFTLCSGAIFGFLLSGLVDYHRRGETLKLWDKLIRPQEHIVDMSDVEAKSGIQQCSRISIKKSKAAVCLDCPQNIRVWGMSRLTLKHIGKHYLRRIEAIVFEGCLITIGAIAYTIFNSFKARNFYAVDFAVAFIGFYLLLVIGLLLMLILIHGANANQAFVLAQTCIQDKRFANDDRCLLLHRAKSCELAKEEAAVHGTSSIDDPYVLETCNRLLSTTSEQLRIDNRIRPVTFFGLRADFALLSALSPVVASGVAFAANTIYQNLSR